MLCDNCKNYKTMAEDGEYTICKNGCVFSMRYKKGSNRCLKESICNMEIKDGKISVCSEYEKEDKDNV